MVTSPPRRRLDLRLVESELAPTRERAQSLIAAGLVEVDGSRAVSAAQPVGESSAVRVLGSDHPYASRAGSKLAGGLDHFGVDPAGRIALDAGASTGGFTDVLLERGAALVYAIDVGRGQLDPRLARNERVVVMDRTNLRLLEALPGEPPSLVSLDLSFISLRLVLARVCALTTPGAEVVALFKPQFELGRDAVGKGGIVHDQTRAEAAAAEFLDWAHERFGCSTQAPVPASVRGTKGNQEWMVHLRLPGGSA
ncbi:MAG: TlyA family rRNA (cytidine-2'-O)-methyltransferase [Candidatus Dormibacteria bacterium]